MSYISKNAPRYIATLATESREGGRMLDKKVPWYVYTLFAVTGQPDNPLRDIATLRVWGGKSANASTVYASFWLHCSGVPGVPGEAAYNSGSGRAGGYGWCKASGAAFDAMQAAGVKIFHKPTGDQPGPLGSPAHLGGAGMETIQEALQAVGVACGYQPGQIYVHAVSC